ncbi:MAG: prenyltransferase [Candidatus Bathyarchaeia archaeon]
MGNLVSITRANFLPLTIVIVLAGLAAAFYSHRTILPIDAALVMVGALLTHASVNAFNNYFDYRSKIDAKTPKTPFSGGVDILVKGMMKPSEALTVCLFTIICAALIGIYFLIRLFSVLLPLIVYGALIIVFYTPILSRIPALSEIVAGSGFGLMGLGVYITQTGIIDAAGIAILIPITILVALLLFLNEFPDAEVDRAGGRRHIVILLGKRGSAWLYVAGQAATYASIILAVAVGAAPFPVLVSLLSLPIAYKAGRLTLKNYNRTLDLVPALASNVLFILSTITLMACGFAIASVVQRVAF